MGQLSLMANESETYVYGTKNTTAEQVAVKAHARKRQSGNVVVHCTERDPHGIVEHRLSQEGGARLRCLRLGDRGDWQRGPPGLKMDPVRL